VGLTYRVFSYHPVKGSHVPHESPDQARANCTPGATQAVSRSLLRWSWSKTEAPILTPSVYAFDASIGSLIAHLRDPYLTYPCTPFPHPLTTRGLSTPSSVRRFEVCSCKPTSRNLPSSLVQPRGATVLAYFLIWKDMYLQDDLSLATTYQSPDFAERSSIIYCRLIVCRHEDWAEVLSCQNAGPVVNRRSEFR
jgi:hypothetical protein